MEQNIQKKFNQAQNEIRLAIMDFIITEKAAFQSGNGWIWRIKKHPAFRPGRFRCHYSRTPRKRWHGSG